MRGKDKKSAAQHITCSYDPYFSLKYMFEKTERYTLTSDQLITVPPDLTATVYFDYADPLPIAPCSRKNLVKIAKIRGDKLGKQFYIIFSKEQAPLVKDWGIGKIPLKCDNLDFQIGANGKFEFSVTDPDKYINQLPGEPAQIYTESDVVVGVKNMITAGATEIVKQLFDEVGTIVPNCAFLCDEFALRLNDRFIHDKALDSKGVTLSFVDIDHMGVRADDKDEAAKRLRRTAQQEKARRERNSRDAVRSEAESTTDNVSTESENTERSIANTEQTDISAPDAKATAPTVNTADTANTEAAPRVRRTTAGTKSAKPSARGSKKPSTGATAKATTETVATRTTEAVESADTESIKLTLDEPIALTADEPIALTADEPIALGEDTVTEGAFSADTEGSAEAPVISSEAGKATTTEAPVISSEAGKATTAETPVISSKTGKATTAEAPVISSEAGKATTAEAPVISSEAGKATTAEAPVISSEAGKTTTAEAPVISSEAGKATTAEATAAKPPKKGTGGTAKRTVKKKRPAITASTLWEPIFTDSSDAASEGDTLSNPGSPTSAGSDSDGSAQQS